MAAPAAHRPLAPEEYLAMEAVSEVKHEFLRGEVFAMAGATASHNQIAVNLVTRLRDHLRGSVCRVYVSDVKLRVEAADAYFYPDLFVTCDPEDHADPAVKRRARLIVEILSVSTAAYDRTDKFDDYRKLETLEEYVLIDSRKQSVMVYRRGADTDTWLLELLPATGTLRVVCVNLSIPVSTLYEDADVPRI